MTSQSGPNDLVWILGATGRIGSALAVRLASTVGSLVLVGRNAVRLSAVAASIDDRIATLVVRSPEEAAVEIKRNHPAVVVNTIGPFCRTVVPIARACPPAGHYVDVVLDVGAVSALLAMRRRRSQRAARL